MFKINGTWYELPLGEKTAQEWFEQFYDEEEVEMGTKLEFHEEGRAAKMALALQAEGFGVTWVPDFRPQIVMTSASKAQVREVSSKTKGVVSDWSQMARIDCGAREGRHA